MKKFLLLLTLLITAFGFANAEDYTYQYDWTAGTSNPFSSSTKTANLGSASWTLQINTDSYGVDNGLKFGTNTKNPFPLTLSTESFSDEIAAVKINTRTNSSSNGLLAVKVNGVNYTLSTDATKTTADLTSTNTEYIFVGSQKGKIEILYTQSKTAAKAIYVKGISIAYKETRELGDINVSYSGGDVTANSTVTVPNGTVFSIAADNATSITVNGTTTNAATATYTATTSETINVSATDGTVTKNFSFSTDVYTAPDAPTFSVDGVSTGAENGYFYGAKLLMIGNGSIYYTTDDSTPSATDGTLYSEAIALPEGTTTYNAIVTDGSHDSAVTSATYTIKKLTAAWSVTDGTEVYPGSELTVTANADAAKIFINGAEATSYTIPETAAIGSEITLSAYATVEADNATVTSETTTITVKVVEQPKEVVIDTKFFGTMTASSYKAYTAEDDFATYATVMNYQNSKLYWKTSSNNGCGLIINCKQGYYIESIDMSSPSAYVNVFTSENAYNATTDLASANRVGQITTASNAVSSYSFTGTPQYVGLRPNGTSSMNFVSITIHYKKFGSDKPAIKLAWSASNFTTDIVSKDVADAPALTVTAPDGMAEADAKALVKYESSKPSVATIDDNGNLEILGLGATDIKAYIDDTDYQSAEAIYKLVVIDPNAVTATDRLNKDCFEGITSSYSTFHYTSPATGITYAACTNYNSGKSGMTLNDSGKGSSAPYYDPGFGVSSNTLGWIAKKITVQYSETISPSEKMLIVTRDDNGFDIVTKEEATANDTYFGHLDAWAYLKEVGENNVPKIATPTSTDEPLSYTFEIGSEPKFLAVMTKNAHYIDYIEIEWEKSATPEVKILSEDDTSITVGVEHADYILHYKKIHNNNWNNHWGSEAANAPARVAQDTTGEPLADSEDWVSTGTNTITIDKTIADHQNRHYKFTAFHKDDTALANELNHVNFLIDGDGTLTGIEGIGAEAGADAPAEYYDLQGRRVANPVSGLYIRRTGSKVEKVFVK